MRSIAVAVLLGAAVMCAMVGSAAAANCNVEAAACADSFHACNLATPYETCSTSPEGCYKSYLQCMLGVCKDDDSLFLEAKDACLGACPAVSFVCDRAAPLTPSWVVPLFVASLAAAGAAVLGAAAA